jgi:type I restriction enzyme R subunit
VVPPAAPLPDNLRVDIVHLAEEIVVDIADHAGLVRFWHNPHAQDELRRRVIQTLDDRDLFPFAEQAVVADKVMELARANQPLIAQRAGGGRRP